MRIIYFISFLLLPCFLHAQAINQFPEVSSSYAVDSHSTWHLADLKQKEFQAFKQNDKVNIGYNKNAAVWCAFKIKNTQLSKGLKTWLCFNNNHIDSLSLYDGKEIKTIGDRTDARSPFIETLAFELNLQPGEEKIFWVRVKKETSFLDFSYSLENQSYLERKSSRKTALTSFFIGIVFLLLMINGILFLMTKNRLYVYYIGYSILTAFYTAITTNFAKHVLFPEFRFFSEGRVYTGALWYIALSIFLGHFLKLKENQPLKHKLIIVLGALNFLLILVSILLLVFYRDFEFRYIFVLGYIIFLASIVILFWSALIHLKIEKTQAIYALMAFAPQLVWGACLILKTFEIIPQSLGDNWMLFISLYEVFLFGYVLSRNYIDIFLKNNELMQQVIFEKETSLRAISEVQLRERRNIANIIHDNVGSKIAHIIHLFDMKNTKLAKHTITELAADIREISHKILPKALDEGALISSLQSQISSLNAGLTNAKIELFHYDFPDRIDEKWIYDLYLIALEVINNAIKHGNAELITLELYKYPKNYHFQFTDDGLGFDLHKTSKGFGLENIEKRVNYYKGNFEISSVKNEGTIIQINIPSNR
ncbi:sensor histidine kinase [Pedobacter rhizosphaerae]|uniref:Signal transduction histidine kinase n=1 Tax=Pedobacter rhizosphaerae TaxID=390241 RepID=A0A1H9IRY4_9SPHI|nr:7TM diverse intracellular signaling domain-containing protein [Pedobacter rhizosphaerae]SEQ77277.1 Signal transduction histidine kinase [Pedobacter rhizosphaerae]